MKFPYRLETAFTIQPGASAGDIEGVLGELTGQLAEFTFTTGPEQGLVNIRRPDPADFSLFANNTDPAEDFFLNCNTAFIDGSGDGVDFNPGQRSLIYCVRSDNWIGIAQLGPFAGGA